METIMLKKLFIILLCALFPLFFIASASAADKLPMDGSDYWGFWIRFRNTLISLAA